MERIKKEDWGKTDLAMVKFLDKLPESEYVKYCEEDGIAITKREQCGYEDQENN